ncbi:MAG: TonB-dependent receptor plug domain-containing protein [Terracidiphilus sp.]
MAAYALVWIATISLLASPSRGGESQNDLANQSLQDLMNMQVTTVSKTEQKLSQTAAAVFVITQEEIARSGATNIPDLLRMVPGMNVAQIDSNTWAVNARGFNSRFANELQVLVDGRSVYSDSFGGVFWDQLDLPLEDVERIEVIRGPGGSVWGGNSVNGVIDVITKKASETQGALAVGGGGTEEQGF